MKMKLPHFFLLFLFFSVSYAQDVDLSIAQIPENLLKNVNSVVRFSHSTLEIENQRSMNITVESAVTVLNKFADDEAELVVHYDKNTRIKNLKVIVYDANGKEHLKINKSKFDDYSAADGMSLFNDGRLKHYQYVPISYPYTFYYAYEIDTENTAFIQSWQPIQSYNQSIQLHTFSIEHPSALKLQRLERGFEGFAVKKNEEGAIQHYALSNTPGVPYEELNPGLDKITPKVRFGLNKFHLEGYDGSADSWKDFGLWMYENLISSRLDLPETTKARIQDMVKGVDDPIERAKIVYDYVQQKTRYISVQVGIGGWMPMLASEVDRLSYGDCKALTNYTKALMDAAGVESYYTAVYASERKDIEKDLVSVQGNHVILNLPQADGDIWLECTDQKVPFGYQGTFTDDRHVLVLKPEGGELKYTGGYTDEQNTQTTKATINIDAKGTLTSTLNIESEGIQYDDHFELENESKREINAYYKDEYWSHLNNLTLEKYAFSNDKEQIKFREDLQVSALNYASSSGDRMLLSLNAFNRVSRVPKRYSKRRHPFEVYYGYTDVDEYLINYPKEFSIEGMASNIKLNNKFGEYQITIEKLPNNQLQFTRKLTLKKGLYPAEDYGEYRDFRRAIVKHDKAKIALIKSKS